MATTNSPEYAGYVATPPVLQAPGKWYGRLRGFEAVVALAGQASGDDINLFVLPQGFRPVFGVIQTTTSLGSATASIGVAGATGKYRAAATFTAIETPTLFGVTAGVSAVLEAAETVKLTIGTAALPGSGTLLVRLFGTGAD